MVLRRLRYEALLTWPEHTPTYTTGRRDSSPNPDTLHPEEEKVQNVGASFFITKRGGQVTYHGPGQLVGYPIMDLNNMEVSLVPTGPRGRDRNDVHELTGSDVNQMFCRLCSESACCICQ